MMVSVELPSWLQRPDIAGDGIEFQSIDIARDGVGLVNVPGGIVFDNRALAAEQALGIGAVRIGHPDIAIGQGDRVRRRITGRRLRQGCDVIDFRHYELSIGPVASPCRDLIMRT